MTRVLRKKRRVQRVADEVRKLPEASLVKETTTVDPDCGLSTGSTLLNLACSNHPEVGFMPGRYYFLVGDSASGKTFLSMTCLAEACLNPNFADYRFIYDDVEGGNMFDVRSLFGSKVAERMEPPRLVDGDPVASYRIEDFYYNIDDCLRDGRPFIYILDSMDGLTSEQEESKFQEGKAAARKGSQSAGSYGDGKAKKNASGIRQLLTPLRESGSILIVINQTRDNLGFGFEKKARSGGHALRFYATLEIWSAIKSRWIKTIKGKKRQIGVVSQLNIKKNRLTGGTHTVEVPIHRTYGIDDTLSCVRYLVEEGWWKTGGSKIITNGLFPEDEACTEDKLVRAIEEGNLVDDLRDIVAQCWEDIEHAMKPNRAPRYE